MDRQPGRQQALQAANRHRRSRDRPTERASDAPKRPSDNASLLGRAGKTENERAFESPAADATYESVGGAVAVQA